MVIAFYRMFFSTLILAAILCWRSSEQQLNRRQRALSFLAGACFAGDLSLWHHAIISTSVANATFLVNTTPIYVGLYGWWSGRDRPGMALLLGGLVAFLGCALLVQTDLGHAKRSQADLLALAAAVFYAGFLLLTKSVRESGSTLGVLAWSGAGATCVSGCVALLLGEPFWGFPSHSWWAISGSVFINQLAGVVALVWALRYLRASFASLALLGQPLGTALWGWWLLGEALHPSQWLGGMLLLSGIFWASQVSSDPRAIHQQRNQAC